MINKLFTIKYKKEIVDNEIFDITECNDPILKEFNAFRKFCDLEIYRKYRFTGIVSPKFEKKLGITKEDALNFVDEKFDIILFHPYPLELKIQDNFLHLAEYEHPGIAIALKRLWLQLFNEELPYIFLPENELYCIHCNYFIANDFFWEEYAKIVSKINHLYISNQLDYLFGTTNYNLSDKKEYLMELFPFVFERLLTHFLFKNKEKFRIKNISLNSEFISVPLFRFENILIRILSKINNKSISTKIYFKLRKIVFRILNKLKEGGTNE